MRVLLALMSLGALNLVALDPSPVGLTVLVAWTILRQKAARIQRYRRSTLQGRVSDPASYLDSRRMCALALAYRRIFGIHRLLNWADGRPRHVRWYFVH